MTTIPCAVDVTTLASGMQAVTISNALVRVTVLPEKGADIYALVHQPSGIDVLWKSPTGLRPLGHGRASPDSTVAWLEHYEGGWQECFPNGGDPCQYGGVELSFHGESTMLPWQFTVVEQGERAVVEFFVSLYRSPLRLRRRMILEATTATLQLHEQLTNTAAEPIDCMWGHHPAFGAPLVGSSARLATNARIALADATNDGPHQPLLLGARGQWPYLPTKTGGLLDLRCLPSNNEPRALLAYLFDFDGAPWYALSNADAGIGVGMTWPDSAFSCLWLWQELHASGGFPFYKRVDTMAVEPWSSYPGHGLTHVMETTQTHLRLGPGETHASTLVVTLFSIDIDQDVRTISPTGVVELTTM
ncbi:MAG: aldose 1-epimerase [Roseiflexaceae bacterium]|nr:aldose 1-epimerase [Roseiflexaceae bacterium]